MILHLSAAGVPTCWTITALYHDAYRIALDSATAVHAGGGEPQAVIEIDRGRVTRSELFWIADVQKSQKPDGTLILQDISWTYRLPDEIVAAAKERLNELLREVGYLIPREEWRIRYPSSALVSDRFSEWHRACRESDGGSPAWDNRWAMFMDAPDGWTPDYVVSPDGHHVQPAAAGADDPTGGRRWDDPDEAANVMRAMNSGWTYEQALVLQMREPVA